MVELVEDKPLCGKFVTRFERRSMSKLSRRAMLKLTGLSGLAAGSAPLLTRTLAQETTAITNGAGFYRFSVGTATVTVLSDGQGVMEETFPNWGANPDLQEAFVQTLEENYLPVAPSINNFNPMLVDTGANRVLVDTGLGGGGGPTTGKLLAHLQNAGVVPEDIDTVFLTHAHPDHIQGLLGEGGLAFPNAQLVMGEAEFNFWTSQSEPPPFIQNVLLPNQDSFTLIGENAEIVPGLTTVASYGHTPGHLAVFVDGGEQQLMHFGDAGGHWLLSLLYPEHYLGFDADPEAAVATRAQLFERVSSDGTMVIGYHYPWPGVGYVKAVDDHYEFVPALFRW
jgi:glyoxylase-like metal-dependent hydrolase (beta-lactamase superfamily II)